MFKKSSCSRMPVLCDIAQMSLGGRFGGGSSATADRAATGRVACAIILLACLPDDVENPFKVLMCSKRFEIDLNLPLAALPFSYFPHSAPSILLMLHRMECTDRKVVHD